VARIIALANQKGGVGKTTTVISLGAALAELGQRVLLVDFDPQGALSVGVGVNSIELDQTIYNLLLDRSVSFSDVMVKTGFAGVELLPGNIDLSAAEVVLVSEVAREQALKRVLGPIRPDYDYVLIDCPPSLGLLTVNALTASDTVIIPLECEFFALRGMALLVDTIEKVRDRLNPELEIEGVVATMFDGRTLHAREVIARVREAFGTRLFTTTIPRTVRFAEAPVVGESILTYAGDSKGAGAYRALAKEVLGIVDDATGDPTGSRGTLQNDELAEGREPGRDPGPTWDATGGPAPALIDVTTSTDEVSVDTEIYR
jgi:chromosome partitioning protein